MNEIEITICNNELDAIKSRVFAGPGVFPFLRPGIYSYESGMLEFDGKRILVGSNVSE